MDPLRLLVTAQGFFTRAEARAVGYGDRDVARAMRSRTWHRIRRGYYTFLDEWTGLDPVGRHAATARAVAHSLGDAVALSHVSGLVVHGADIWGCDLSRIHVTRLDGGAGRVEGDVVHHEGRCIEGDVVESGGLSVLLPERCAIETASRTTNEVALVIFDGVLRAGHVDHDGLFRRFELMEHWPYTQHLHVPVRMADARAASVGESRGRWLFRCCGLPAPVLQYDVRSASGALLGTSDWAWPDHGLLGEFDGKVKYGRLLKPGETAADAVFREKVREDQLREATGMSMVRLVWRDYDAPQATGERVRSRLRRLA
ncbi:type IV toxin-antitoxin system AbiEi family antitoxin domain-containing protein [Nocardioides sp. YIM 152315]|uniref:type IV toxin-antitoxin system AbiEi family antitoxin domain-containing protein n=1 Tax=Nocardioides sp. YIM 152315 TaxID=3031760 RepID=UPI0023DC3658|nr:type IV toxin-antitoxin system AbiEi family antitoxin domain-containing protein [Nocardioides sp. YIM 152315]MDF1602576.1 type IV toxin-antitoxin system AbiEi family antitoxin domain-containing protein [Nocardioides sp. YIM 152315]